MLKEALFHRVYHQVPYELTLECESISTKSNGVHFAQFRVMVPSEIVQRMVIGKKGQNINWVRDHFKANYAKTYGVEVEVHVRVVIRKKMMMH
jgi:GTPase Era involved in 16S rRNA processing